MSLVLVLLALPAAFAVETCPGGDRAVLYVDDPPGTRSKAVCIMGACPDSKYTCLNDGLSEMLCCDKSIPAPSPPSPGPGPAPCVDKVNRITGTSDCSKNAGRCNNADYYTLMTEQCPRTCGRCPGTAPAPAPSTCVDKLNRITGTSDCSKNAGLCNDADYYTLMTEQCPKTCGRCPGTAPAPSTCVDKKNPATGTSDCAKNAIRCNDPYYRTLMTEQCPKTCGRC